MKLPSKVNVLSLDGAPGLVAFLESSSLWEKKCSLRYQSTEKMEQDKQAGPNPTLVVGN